jgi:hypothetical protein
VLKGDFVVTHAPDGDIEVLGKQEFEERFRTPQLPQYQQLPCYRPHADYWQAQPWWQGASSFNRPQIGVGVLPTTTA